MAGWAAVVRKGDRIWRMADSGSATSHNYAEAMACIMVTRWLKKPSKVKMVSDSTWLIEMAQRAIRNVKEPKMRQRPQFRQLKQISELARPHEIEWVWKKRNSTEDLEVADWMAGVKCHGTKSVIDTLLMEMLLEGR